MPLNPPAKQPDKAEKATQAVQSVAYTARRVAGQNQVLFAFFLGEIVGIVLWGAK